MDDVLRERLARIICCFAKENSSCAECKENTFPGHKFPDCFWDIRSDTDKIGAAIEQWHKEAGYRQLDDDQSLPEIPAFLRDEDGVYHCVRTLPYEYRLATTVQQDMLSAKFRKVEE